ncbi:hypothetical protein GGS26DRAFT_599629 [Hypomontagnella submonticulosa]|nr:hypothetical protein GGS26DRAFT_599629 [Hypomontagnella submonticulosa]
MDTLRRMFCPYKRKKEETNVTDSRGYTISAPLETFQRQPWSTAYYNSEDLSTRMMGFTPQSQGSAATLAWLESGTLEDLTQLLGERDHAAKQLRCGPKTMGTAEVQLILREPSIRSMEHLHRVRDDAELTLKYGAPGRVAYNFSKSFTWNKNNAQKVPSLQLMDFEETMVKDHRGLFTNLSQYPPILPTQSWLDLRASKISTGNNQSPSPITEPVLVRDPHANSSTETYSSVTDSDNSAEDEWEVREAKILTMTKIPIWQELLE